MSRTRRIAAPAAAVLVLGVISAVTATAGTAGAAAPATTKITVHKVGTSHMTGTAPGGGELAPFSGEEAGQSVKAVKNRSSRSQARADRVSYVPSGVNPTQTLSVGAPAQSGWRAINHYEQRFSDGGNQYSVTPPDQGMCTNGSQVVEGVNDAIRIYSSSGAPLSPVYSANQFFWGDHYIDRSTGVTSPHQMTDPSCVYDVGTNRFYLVMLELAGDSAGNLTGPSFIDIAVSAPGNATAAWSIYQFDVTDDGNHNTPSHPNCPCIGDYPHIGTDANGFYVTTNEYPTFGDGYNGAQVYAIDKYALAAGTAKLPGAAFSTARAESTPNGFADGFTLAPALAADGQYANNTMYFLSSDAAPEATGAPSTRVLMWTLAHTNALRTDPTQLTLTNAPVTVNKYAIPPASNQKPGSVPLADCLNDTACSKVVLGTKQPDKYKESEFAFDSNDTRMLQSAYAHGLLWGALDTAVDVGGATKAGVGYYVINPSTKQLVKQGTLAVARNNITYPALGVTSAGKAAMALTLVGSDYYPSAAWVRLDDGAGTTASAVHVVGTGLGPDDDFSGYRGFLYNRPRWGDYGAASVVGGKVWIASEYIAQTCTLAQYEASPFGTCGGTRSALANWATHIASVTP